MPDTFSRYTINDDGTLAANPVTSTATFAAQYPFSLTPNGQFAIVPYGNTVSSYSINPAGTFTLVDNLPAGRNACTVAIDPTGRFAYVGNFQDSTISQYAISSTGVLTAIGTLSTSPIFVYFLQFSPQGFLYSAGCCALGAVSEYAMDSSSGELSLVGNFVSGDSVGTEPISFAFNPSGSFVYAVNSSTTIADFSLSSFTVDSSTGTLADNGPDIINGYNLVVEVDPSGKFAYAMSPNLISQFTISDSGTLVANGSTALSGAVTGIAGGTLVFAQK